MSETLDYSRSLTGVDLDDVNDTLFNEAYSTWVKFVIEQLDKLREGKLPKDIAFFDKIQTRLISETYEEYTDIAQTTMAILRKHCSLNNNLLPTDRCQATFVTVEQAKEVESKLNEEIQREMGKLAQLRQESKLMEVINKKLDELIAECKQTTLALNEQTSANAAKEEEALAVCPKC